MSSLPPDTKQPSGFAPYGVDAAGKSIFFGLRFPDNSILNFQFAHSGLADLIKYLQTISTEARKRRVALDPMARELEAKGRLHNPVHSIDWEIDSSGQQANLVATTLDGLLVNIQMPYVLVDGLSAQLPSVLLEMREKQKAAGGKH